MGDNTSISPYLDPRRSSHSRQNSVSLSPASSVQNTPVYMESASSIFLPISITAEKTTPTVGQEEVAKYIRKCPRLESTFFKPVREILNPKLYDDLIGYECLMENGEKQNCNTVHLRAQEIADYEFSANRINKPIMYNKDFKAPRPDRITHITTYEQEDGKETAFALLRYENDYHSLIYLKDACRNHALLVEEYFNRTLFNTI
ncbi:hypothetical protein M3Y97_00432500 [Aphelenchoides bicaudatus]|nr:hypothetical protein M3Y97_00432500 [Aphelenchoides bicaudatus]